MEAAGAASREAAPSKAPMAASTTPNNAVVSELSCSKATPAEADRAMMAQKISRRESLECPKNGATTSTVKGESEPMRVNTKVDV